MSIIFILIPLGLVLLGIAIWAFVWAVDHDQFEDLDRAGASILFEENESSQPDEAQDDEVVH
jgi:cbb3-type cytochrome oxidase maturation protein